MYGQMLVARALTFVMIAGLSLVSSSSFIGDDSSGQWVETRFQTGCDPGPSQPPPPREHAETHYPPLGTTLEPATVEVNLGAAPEQAEQTILGSGFNFEHAL